MTAADELWGECERRFSDPALNRKKASLGYLADPGEARDCFTNSFVWCVILFLLQLYGAASPKRFEIALPVTK